MAIFIYEIRRAFRMLVREHRAGSTEGAAMGATRKDIGWLVMQQGVGIAALGTAIGCCGHGADC